MNNKEIVFKIGDIRGQGLSTMKIDIPVSNYGFIEVSAHVIRVDLPFLQGLDVLSKMRVIKTSDEDTILFKLYGWNVSLMRKSGHAYIKRTPTILYIERELRKINCHFYDLNLSNCPPY